MEHKQQYICEHKSYSERSFAAGMFVGFATNNWSKPENPYLYMCCYYGRWVNIDRDVYKQTFNLDDPRYKSAIQNI